MNSYWQYLFSTLCIVTYSLWRVFCLQLQTVYGQYIKYTYLQYIDSNLCTVTGSIWTVPYVELPAVYEQ